MAHLTGKAGRLSAMLRLRPLVLLFLVSAAGLCAQAPTITTAIPNQSLTTTSAEASIDLGTHFGYTGVTGPVARFETVLGDFDVELLSTAAPKHVENFTVYANEALYDQSWIHRTAVLEANNTAANIVQGGGYFIEPTSTGTVRKVITKKDPIALEYNQANARGTLAAARTSDPNSATSEWFFNVKDNTTILGPTNGGGYTVFGRVVGTGMQVVDAIAALPTFVFSDLFTTLPLRDYTGGPVLDSNLVVIERVRVLPVQPAADGTTDGLIIYSVTTSSSGVVQPTLLGRTLKLSPRAAGTATVTVSARDARNVAVSQSFTVNVSAGGPIITTAPQSQTVAPGGTATFSVVATGAGTLTYQWRKNGTALAGATSSTLTLPNLSAGDAGDYSVAITNSIGTTISRAATLTVAQPSSGGLINLSVRANGAQLIVGFVAEGGDVDVVVRAVGPTLAANFNLPGAMTDPQLSLNPSGASNNDWGSTAQAELEAAFSQVGAFPLAAATSKDAALLAQLSGSNTALVTPASGGAGVVLAELYDRRQGSGRLVNVSARAQVGTEANVLIAGFVISGNVPKRVLVRAVGPTLGTNYGVANVLANPVLELYRAETSGNVLVATNDDWGTDPEVVGGPAIGFPLIPGSADAALLVTLQPGAYSALVRGFGGTTGEALVEVYEVP
jgi:cyclophilin family peptidyl-prolyl cis-trans isomerase